MATLLKRLKIIKKTLHPSSALLVSSRNPLHSSSSATIQQFLNPKILASSTSSLQHSLGLLKKPLALIPIAPTAPYSEYSSVLIYYNTTAQSWPPEGTPSTRSRSRSLFKNSNIFIPSEQFWPQGNLCTHDDLKTRVSYSKHPHLL